MIKIWENSLHFNNEETKKLVANILSFLNWMKQSKKVFLYTTKKEYNEKRFIKNQKENLPERI